MAARNGKKSFYEEAMETFHRAADLIDMNPRVRMELEEPDFEHIFYVTIEIRDRLVPLSDEEAAEFRDVTPIGYARQFQEPGWVNGPAITAIAQRGGTR